MPAPLNSFIACQIVTLKKAGFSYQKIADELGLKAKSTTQSVFRRYNKNKRTKVIYQKKSTGRPPKLSEKTQRKLVNVLKDPKTTLERTQVEYNSFSTKVSFSRKTVRRILRKHGVYSRLAAKKISIKKTSAAFRKKRSQKMIKKSAECWYSVVFTNETRVKLTSDGIVRVFCKKHSLCAKKHQKCDN